MIGRSIRVATPAERGEGAFPGWWRDPPRERKREEHDLAHTEHDPVLDTVDRDSVPYQIERCRRCGIVAPPASGVCRGRNRTLDEFGDE
jgi:hypothetical protein